MTADEIDELLQQRFSGALSHEYLERVARETEEARQLLAPAIDGTGRLAEQLSEIARPALMVERTVMAELERIGESWSLVRNEQVESLMTEAERFQQVVPEGLLAEIERASDMWRIPDEELAALTREAEKLDQFARTFAPAELEEVQRATESWKIFSADQLTAMEREAQRWNLSALGSIDVSVAARLAHLDDLDTLDAEVYDPGLVDRVRALSPHQRKELQLIALLVLVAFARLFTLSERLTATINTVEAYGELRWLILRLQQMLAGDGD